MEGQVNRRRLVMLTQAGGLAHAFRLNQSDTQTTSVLQMLIRKKERKEERKGTKLKKKEKLTLFCCKSLHICSLGTEKIHRIMTVLMAFQKVLGGP